MFSPDQQYALAVSSSVQIWKVASGEPVPTPFKEEGRGVVRFSTDSHFAVRIVDNGVVEVLDIASTRLAAPLHVDSTVQSINFSSDGRMGCLGLADGAIVIFDVGTARGNQPSGGGYACGAKCRFSPKWEVCVLRGE